MPQVFALLEQMGKAPPTHILLSNMMKAAPAHADARKQRAMDEALNKMGSHVQENGVGERRSRTGSIIRGVEVKRTGKMLYGGDSVKKGG